MTRKTGLDWQLLALAGILMALTLWGAFTVVLLDDERAGHVTLTQAPFYALAAWLVVMRPPQDQGRDVARGPGPRDVGARVRRPGHTLVRLHLNDEHLAPRSQVGNRLHAPIAPDRNVRDLHVSVPHHGF